MAHTNRYDDLVNHLKFNKSSQNITNTPSTLLDPIYGEPGFPKSEAALEYHDKYVSKLKDILTRHLKNIKELTKELNEFSNEEIELSYINIDIPELLAHSLELELTLEESLSGDKLLTSSEFDIKDVIE